MKNNTYLYLALLIGLFPAWGWGQMSLRLHSHRTHDLEVNADEDIYTIQTTGGDPWCYTRALGQKRPEHAVILSFEYFCAQGLDHLQIFFGEPTTEKRSHTVSPVGPAEGWVSFAVDLSDSLEKWGQVGDTLRLDWGRQAGVHLQLRSLELRPPTTREQAMVAERAEKRKQNAALGHALKAYVQGSFDGAITQVDVQDEQIVIQGHCPASEPIYLVPVPPYRDVLDMEAIPLSWPITESPFSITVDRYTYLHGRRHDRLLCKWVLIQRKNDHRIMSHARYPDRIVAKHTLPKEVPDGRKGLGGFSVGRGHVEDLKELDITSATVNIWFTRFMFKQPGPDRIKHVYLGEPYYFRERDVQALDETFRTCAEHNMVVAAILLVSKAEQCPDETIGLLTQHPDMDPAGIYSMPNVTGPLSAHCYAAALDFLASRYSRPDKRYGRCHHWIMHNEVDAGWVWTNMGEKPAWVFMDAYHKSMRLCYAIARSYNPHSEVFISLTHYWAWTSHPKFYPAKELMEILLGYTQAEGDFQWGMAHHPYPESLHEPKTWNDLKVTWDFNSPLITFKNLEVLDAWIKQPALLYLGKHKRTLWLSENGTNSPSYSEQDLREQAAGFAYAWKKMKPLDGIDGFQWHNWFDNRREGGLRIGLRRFPDDVNDPGGIKPVWKVYQAADTDREDAVFDPYKEIIGISEWSQVRHSGLVVQ